MSGPAKATLVAWRGMGIRPSARPLRAEHLDAVRRRDVQAARAVDGQPVRAAADGGWAHVASIVDAARVRVNRLGPLAKP